MKIMQLGLVALAVSAANAQLAVANPRTGAGGFIEDSRLTLTNRNYYFNHDKKDDVDDARDWAHALLIYYRSGFTQGTVGFGVDAFSYGALKLDEQGGGGGNVALDDEGDGHSFGHIGGAVKARMSETTLLYGILQPVAPVFAAGGSRILPQTAQGFQLLSEEIDNLAFQAGHFTAATGWRGSSNSDPIQTAYAGIEIDRADYLGGDYVVSDNLSVSLYAADFEDLWRQYYGNASYSLPLSDQQALQVNFNLYRTKDHGQALGGEIDNTAWSLALAYTLGAHCVSIAYQQVDGDEPFDYVGFGSENSSGDSIYLANSVHFSDFNGPGEKSVQVRYDLDMVGYGIPGLKLMTRYINGQDVDGSAADPNGAYANWFGKDDKERELDVEARYVVQSGPAKDLAFRVRQAWHRGDASLGGDTNQFRLMVEYPLEIR